MVCKERAYFQKQRFGAFSSTGFKSCEGYQEASKSIGRSVHVHVFTTNMVVQDVERQKIAAAKNLNISKDKNNKSVRSALPINRGCRRKAVSYFVNKLQGKCYSCLLLLAQ